MKSKKNIFAIISLILGLVCIGCLLWMIIYFIGLNRAEQKQQEMLSMIAEDTEALREDEGKDTSEAEAGTEQETDSEDISYSDSEATDSEASDLEQADDLTEYGVTDRVIDFDKLHEEENPDIYAWIQVPGTVIDYPVLQHPEEMDYYLEHNLDGSKGYPGCIYTQRMNAKDFSDPNTVLYGHNMKNGTMFAGLHQYRDSEFFEENPYIYIYTEDGRILVYKIFAAYEYSDLSLLMNFYMGSEEGRQQYFDSIWENEGLANNFDTEVELTAESRIITLSTCIANKPSNRYLVQGILQAEGEANASIQTD
ncbi:MAG: class B sortase [Acetatifactor sp.]|nr:class B sortase [Acetatifactor sp.]